MAGQCFRYWSAYHEAIGKLTDEQAGRFIRALGEYIFNDNEPDFSDDPILDISFSFVKEQAMTSRDISNRARENGAKGGQQKKGSTSKKGAKNSSAKSSASSSAKSSALSEEKRIEEKRLLHAGIDAAASRDAASMPENPFDVPPDDDE